MEPSSQQTDPTGVNGDRTVLVTGSTSGIGLATARELARSGVRVVVHGPDEESTDRAVAIVRGAVPGARVEGIAADLGSQHEVRRLAETVTRRYGDLDGLVNNAASVFDHWSTNGDGIELTLAVNYLSVYLLTRLLLPDLEGSGRGRVVNVCSEAHRGATLDFEDLQCRQNYERFSAYQRSKLADLMFNYELARRVDPTRVVVNAAHPGTVRTELFRPRNPVERIVMPVLNLRARTPEQAADSIVWLLLSTEAGGSNGGYFADRDRVPSSPESYDEVAAAKLWEVSASLTGLDS